MKNSIEVTVKIDGLPDTCVRAQLPDLAGIEGPISVQGILVPRIHALCARVAELLGRGYVTSHGAIDTRHLMGAILGDK